MAKACRTAKGRFKKCNASGPKRRKTGKKSHHPHHANYAKPRRNAKGQFVRRAKVRTNRRSIGCGCGL